MAGRVAGACFVLRSAVPLFCVRVLHLEPSVGAAAELAFIPILLIFIAFHSVGIARSTENSFPKGAPWRLPVMRWLAAYLAFAGASLLWSMSVSPAVSAVYWCGLLMDAAVVLLLLSIFPAQDVAQSVIRGYVLGACAIAVLAWLMPLQEDLRLGDQEFLNTNQIANICAFGVYFAQILLRKQKMSSRLPALLLSVTLLRTLSKATLIAFVVSQGVLLFRDPNISAQTRRRVILGAVVVLVGASGLLASYYDVYTNAGNQAETLTGRTAIWAWATDQIPDSPWVGHGFDSMWKIMPPLGPDRFEARHAENELLQQVYAYGIAGAALFIGLYWSLYRAFRGMQDSRVRPLLRGLLLFVIVRGLAEAEPFDLLLPVWAIVLFASAVAEDNHSGSMAFDSKEHLIV